MQTDGVPWEAWKQQYLTGKLYLTEPFPDQSTEIGPVCGDSTNTCAAWPKCRCWKKADFNGKFRWELDMRPSHTADYEAWKLDFEMKNKW